MNKQSVILLFLVWLIPYHIYAQAQYVDGRADGKARHLPALQFFLKADEADVIRSLCLNAPQPELARSLKDVRCAAQAGDYNGIEVFYKAITSYMPGVRLADYFLTLESQRQISLKSTNKEVLAFINKRMRDVFSTDSEVLSQRILSYLNDTSLSCEVLPDVYKGNVTVTVFGRTDLPALRQVLTQAGRLEFYGTNTCHEIADLWINASKAYASYLNFAQGKKAPRLVPADTLWQLIDTIPGRASASAWVKLADTMHLNRALRMSEVKGMFPGDAGFAWDAKASTERPGYILLTFLRKTGMPDKPELLNGDVIISSRILW